MGGHRRRHRRRHHRVPDATRHRAGRPLCIASSQLRPLVWLELPGLHGWLVASQASREQVHHIVLAELGLEALMELRMRAGEGVGACFGAQMILTGLQVRRTAARTC